MEDLSLLDQEILDVLKKIEYCCDNAELCYPDSINKRGFLDIVYKDKNHSDLERTLNADRIERYLLKKGIDFELTYNFIDDPSDDYIKLGIIRGKNIQEIKTKVTELINELKTKATSQELVVNKVEIKKKEEVKEEKFQQKVQTKTSSSINIKNGIGFLILDDREIKICSEGNIPFRFLKILTPLGKRVAINAVFNESTSDRSKLSKDKSLSLEQKKDVLKHRVKELQDVLKGKGVNICLDFLDSDETVFLKLKR